ncbi:MAG TPA: TldD/PmbA family protein [bacterium]|nr:TldD/PmbA family protein [bacterium]
MEKMIKNLMDEALAGGAEFADVRCGEGCSTSIEIQDGRAEKVHGSTGRSIGIRVLVDGAWGFSTTYDLSEEWARKCLSEAIEAARTAAPHVAEPAGVAKVEPVVDSVTSEVEKRPDSVPIAEKVKIVFGHERAAREFDSRIENTMLNYSDGVSLMRIANTYGTYIEMENIRTRMAVRVVAREGDLRQSGYESAGRLEGFELIENMRPEDLGMKAARRATELLSAKPAPPGEYPVIFDHTVTGLFVHEAFGHNAEADLVWNGESIIADRMGERIGSELVNIIDDSTIKGAWGSYSYDSEGVPGRRRVLVEKGVVKSFLHSLETAKKFGVVPNGAGRSEGAHNRPIVRMSNTFIAPGESTLEEMISSLDKGVLLKGALSGYVSTETGQFTCRAAEGWLIRNGVMMEQLRDVAVSGMVLEALANVDAVSNEFHIGSPGTCGKNGQGVPVDDGGPHIRVKRLVVGGRE